MHIVLFPNPSNGSFSITGLKHAIDKLTVVNSVGQVVETIENTGNTIHLELERGMYYITLISNDEVINKKINIE
jgi:hypothetical protein